MRGSKPIAYLHWHHDPVPFAMIPQHADSVKQGIVRRAIARGLLPLDARRFTARLASMIDDGVLLLPLKESWRPSGKLRPEVADFIRRHVRITPPELAALVEGKETDLSRYVREYQEVLRREAPAWHEFLDGRSDQPPGGYGVEISTEPDLEAWLDLVAASPLLDRALDPVREHLELLLRAAAEEERVRDLEQRFRITIKWSPVRRFRFDEGYNYEATVSGTAGSRELKATFEKVFDFGLIIRTPKGVVYRNQDGTWRRLEDDQPLGDPEFEAFLDVAHHRMPPELRLRLM